YFFQAWGNRAPNPKYRDMLLHTATEEIGHIEMLAHAVALNLEKAPTHLQEEGVKDSLVGAVMGGENPRHKIEGMIHKNLLSSRAACWRFHISAYSPRRRSSSACVPRSATRPSSSTTI